MNADKKDWLRVLLVVALIAGIAGLAVYRWYTSDVGRRHLYWNEVAAMPGVERVDPDTLHIRLAHDATINEARAALEAIDYDMARTRHSTWFLSLGAADLTVGDHIDPANTVGVDLLTVLGTSEAMASHDVVVEVSANTPEKADISLDGPDAHDTSAATAAVDALAAHPDLVPPEIDLFGGPGTVRLSAEALRNPARVKRNLAVFDEVADLDPRVSMVAEGLVSIEVAHHSDVPHARKRLRTALTGTPDEFTILVNGVVDE